MINYGKMEYLEDLEDFLRISRLAKDIKFVNQIRIVKPCYNFDLTMTNNSEGYSYFSNILTRIHCKNNDPFFKVINYNFLPVVITYKEVIEYTIKLIKKSCYIVVLKYYQDIVERLAMLQQLLPYYLDENFSVLQQWKKEIWNIRIQIKNKIAHYLSKGEDRLKDADYLKMLEDEVEKLEPMAEFYYHPDLEINIPSKIQGSLVELQSQIQGDIKNSNRVTFKLIQELQNQIEEFSEQSKDEKENQIAESVKESVKKINNMKILVIEIFDMLDLIYQSSLKINSSQWSTEIENAVNKTLDILKENGIVEIPVKGQMLNGKTMEVVGTVSEHDISSEFQKYEVYAVHQRGFMETESGNIIRKAFVTTVY